MFKYLSRLSKGSFFPCIAFMITLTVGHGCNSAADTQTTTTDSTTTGQDTIQAVDSIARPGPDPATTVTIKLDTITPLDPAVNEPPEPVKKTATLGYSYYPVMKRGETKTIRAFVSIRHPESKIRDTIRRIEKIQTIESPGNDTSTIDIINDIPFYKRIRIAIDSTDDFDQRAIRPASQEIDTIKGNLWLWQITAKTDKKLANLTILVDAETPQGVSENIDIREINIQIEIDKVTFIRAAINYLGDNPKVSIPLIAGLVAFIGWLIKYYLERKKKTVG